MLNRIKSQLRRYRRDEEGSITAEAVIMFPTLFAAVLATFVFFDAFRNQSINLKANYTIADAVSRENQIDNTFLVNSWNLHRFLTNSPSLTQLRVSLIEYREDTDTHQVIWSRVKGGGSDYEDVKSDVIGLTAAEIPVIPNLEVLIVVQTDVEYEPNFSIGLNKFTFSNTTYTRPRWAPNGICFGDSANSFVGRLCPGDST